MSEWGADMEGKKGEREMIEFSKIKKNTVGKYVRNHVSTY